MMSLAWAAINSIPVLRCMLYAGPGHEVLRNVSGCEIPHIQRKAVDMELLGSACTAMHHRYCRTSNEIL